MRAFINEFVGTGHHAENILIHNNVRTQQIHQCEKVTIAGLERCRSQHDHCICVFTEIANAFVGESLVFIQTAVADMVCFVDDHKIKVWCWIKIEKTILSAAPVLFTLIHATVQDRVRNDGLVISYRPFFITMCIRNCLPKDAAIQWDKILIESLHLQFPFPLSDERLRANDQDVVQLISGLQFLNDQTSLYRFTDANAVRNQNPRLI